MNFGTQFKNEIFNQDETNLTSCTGTQLVCVSYLELRSLLDMDEYWVSVCGLLLCILLELDIIWLIQSVICGDAWWAIVGVWAVEIVELTWLLNGETWLCWVRPLEAWLRDLYSFKIYKLSYCQLIVGLFCKMSNVSLIYSFCLFSSNVRIEFQILWVLYDEHPQSVF